MGLIVRFRETVIYTRHNNIGNRKVYFTKQE